MTRSRGWLPTEHADGTLGLFPGSVRFGSLVVTGTPEGVSMAVQPDPASLYRIMCRIRYVEEASARLVEASHVGTR
jgi:hypothetical protein